jgi:hypothetical protein
MIGAKVLWDPAICSSVIPVLAVGPSGPSQGAFSGLPPEAEIFVFAERRAGLEHVLVLRARRFVQLAARGASVLSRCRLLTDLRLSAGRERVRLEAIAAFNALAAGNSLRGARSHDLLGANRLRFILQALDGFLAGGSQREIAELLFGAPRVRQDWGDAGGHMRDRVRRAVRRGRKLMDGEYIALLR